DVQGGVGSVLHAHDVRPYAEGGRGGHGVPAAVELEKLPGDVLVQLQRVGIIALGNQGRIAGRGRDVRPRGDRIVSAGRHVQDRGGVRDAEVVRDGGAGVDEIPGAADHSGNRDGTGDLG